MSGLKADEGGFPLCSEATESVFRSVTEAEVSLDEMLSLACRQGKQDIVELLLESGANVNHRNKAGNTPLLEACSQGHVSIAKLLLDRSADIDAPTETTFDSALTWACTLGNIDIVLILLDRKANVEHRTKDGCTALMFAALAGHEKVARLLLDHKAKINVESDSNKDSPLTFACWKGHQKVVKLFLERKANIEHRTKEGFSPLMFAALGGHTQVAELLLKHRAEVNTPSGSNNDIPLTSACWKGHHQVVHLLLQHNSDIEHRTKDGCTPLMLAAREGHLSVAKLLLEHNAKVNVPSGSENNIPLTLACWKGHRDVVDLLLDHASNIEHQNKAGCTPLMLAAREGHLEATLLLLDCGAQIDVPSGSNDDTPLTLACWKGHEEVVQLLIERHSSVNHQTKTGCTPLMEATREGHVGVARLLLEAGADVETPDNYGQSPFFMACWKGHAEVAALLLEYDANKDCRTKTGITPLFQACRENHVDVVKLLLDYGCNPSTPFPNSRECPLTLAAEKGYSDLAQLLLSRNASVETRTKKGCSPFYLACKEGFEEISIMLAKHGANTEAPDQRGTTPLLAAYKNGCVDVVEWLLGHVAHLPSDPECQKALMSPMPPDTDLLPQRSKCLELIMKAKKAREQAALKNAQSLFEELDAEREKKETKKKAAAKKRNKRKEKKRKEQAEKMEALCCDDEDDEGTEDLEQRPVEGRQDPGVTADMPVDAPPIVPLECTATPPQSPIPSAAPIKKKPSRKKNKKKLKPIPSEEPDHVTLAPPPPVAYWSDSADSLEFHDAQSELPGCHPTESSSSAKPSSEDLTLSSSQDSIKSSKDTSVPSKLDSPSLTNTSTVKQRSKLATQSKSVSTSRLSKSDEKSSEKSRVISDKTKAPPIRNTKETKTVSAKNQPSKGQTKIDRIKTPSPTSISAPKVPTATQGAVSNNMSTSHNKSKGHVSSTLTKDNRPSEKLKARPFLNAPASDPQRPVGEDGNQSSSQKKQNTSGSDNSMKSQKRNQKDRQHTTSTEQSGWTKASHIRDSSSTSSRDRNTSVSPVPSNQGLYESHVTSQGSNEKVLIGHEENMWNLSNSQSDWVEDMDLADHLMLSRYSTDDDKILSQKLQAAAAAQTYTPSTRPTSTAALPTPSITSTASQSTPSTTTTTVTISSATVPMSQRWHEVTKTTRTVQLTVSNNLVGRIIGRGGTKINSIQDASAAHINVSRNIPKSTDRLITIRGTQRSITRAKELIDEALSTPDSALISATPSPVPSLDGKLSPPLPSQRSISPASQGPKRKYADVVPPSITATPLSSSQTSLTTPSTTTISEASRYVSTEVSPARSTHSTSDSSTTKDSTIIISEKSNVTTVTDSSNKSNKPSPRLRGIDIGGSFASVTAASSGSNLGTGSPALSPGPDDRSLPPRPPSSTSTNSSLASKPDVKDSDLSSSIGVSFGNNLESTTDFPPLRQSRSQSDPQVLVSDEQDQEKETQSLTLQMSKFPLTNKLPPSCAFSPTMPSIEALPSPDKSETSPSVASEKFPFTSPVKSSTDSETTSQEGVVEGLDKSPGSFVRPPSKSDGQVVGILGKSKHRQHRMSLPAKPLPISSQGDPTSEIPSDLPARGNYGAIGPPPRKTSVPSSFGGRHSPPVRKLSHAGLQSTQFRPFPTPLENLGENDPLPPHPPRPTTFTPPPGAPHTQQEGVWFQEAAGPTRGRSVSLPGQHPNVFHGPTSVPPPYQQGPFIPKSHSFSKSDMGHHHVPPSSPGPHHREGSTPHSQGVYGAIGPSSTSNVHIMKPHPNHHTHSHLPNQGDVWIQQFPGPVGSHNRQGQPSFPPRPPNFPPQGPPFPPSMQPIGFGPGPSMNAPHMMQREMAQKLKPVGNHRAVRQGGGYDDQSNYHHPGPGGATQWGGSQKRWSVPGYTSIPRPAVPLNPIWSQQPPPPPGRGGNVQSFLLDQSADGNQFLTGNGSLVVNDPWGSSWSNLSSAPKPSSTIHQAPPTSSLPPMSVSFSDTQTSSSSKVVPSSSESWLSSSEESEDPVGEPPVLGGDLQQLLKSLDISDEHARALKARKLSLQQLHSMSDEEWRSLKLPVGPRVKLMNAVSNIPLSGSEGKADESPGKNSDQSDDQPTTSPLAQAFNTSVTVATTQASDSFLPSSFQ